MAIRATHITFFELRLDTAPTNARGNKDAHFTCFYTANVVKFEDHGIT